MIFKSQDIPSLDVLKKASHQLKSLKSEIALTFLQGKSIEQSANKAQQLALAQIQKIEKDIKNGLESYVKKVTLFQTEYRDI